MTKLNPAVLPALVAIAAFPPLAVIALGVMIIAIGVSMIDD